MKTKQKEVKDKIDKKDNPKKGKVNAYDRVVKYGKDGDFTNDGYEVDCDLTEIGE